MKMKKIITIFLAMVFILNINQVKASDLPIEIAGKSWIEPEGEQTAIVKISTEEKIGVISGKIEHTAEIDHITVKGLNNWTLTFNTQTKEFNLYKAEGSQEEAIMEIIYTAGSTEGTGRIVISDIQMTTINYDTIQIPEEVEKQIEISHEKNDDNDNHDDNEPDDDEDNEEPGDNEEDNNKPSDDENNDNNQPDTDNDENNSGNDTDKDEDNNNNTTPNKDNQNTTSNEEEKKNNQTIKTDNTIKNSILPKTGVTQVILVITVVVLGIIAFVCYHAHKKYKGI